MNILHSSLIVSALLMLAACNEADSVSSSSENSSGSTAGDLSSSSGTASEPSSASNGTGVIPKGTWLSDGAYIDDIDGNAQDFYCLLSDGSAIEQISYGEDDGWVDITRFQGPYTLNATQLSADFTQKAEYTNEGDGTVPTDISGLTFESMGDDKYAFTASYVISGNAVILSISSYKETWTPVTDVPAYVASVPCN